jgi:hypothetical protein
MQAIPTGILAIDVVSSSWMSEQQQRDTSNHLRRATDRFAAKAAHVSHTGDGVFAAFRGCEVAYEALRDFSFEWLSSEREVPPVIRTALHTGIVGSSLVPGTPVWGAPVNLAARLATGTADDFVRISEPMYEEIATRLKHDAVPLSEQVVILSTWGEFTVYDAPLESFSTVRSRLIRLASPADLIHFLAAQPEEMFHMSPRRFEEVIAEVLKQMGYEVELTKQTRDDGIDIIAIGRSSALSLHEKYLVQCKRNARSHKVNISVVNELLGVGERNPSTGLILATTSTFTAPARAAAQNERVKWRLHLRDYNDIWAWLQDYSRR